MGQQSQSQAQAQAQISALQQQNAMLNQHLQSQAQSHINHLQQLIPFHQPPQPFQPTSASFQSTPQPPVPQAPDPPAPAATPANQPGPSTPFNPDEMLQQMKSTVESSIQAMVEKTQVQSTPPPNLPDATPLHPTSHHPSTLQHPPPRQPSPRRSWSHHHGASPRRPDKRPVSTRRSPPRRRSSRRHRRSSRNRSYCRSQSRHRHDSRRRDRESSITLKSASPQRRDDRQPTEEYHQLHDYSSTQPTLQASSWWKNQHSTEYNNPTEDSYHPEKSSSAKWKSCGEWKNYPKNPSSKYQSTWEDPKQSSNRYDSSHDPATTPLTAFSTSKSALTRHKKTTPDNSGDDQSQFSESIPSGHMLINLRDGSKAEWIRGVRFGLRHPDRMKAASEIPYAEQPKPIKTIGIEEFQGAVATLQQTDPKIPSEITRKAIHLISSTNLLPVFDLERSFIIDLPSTNMLALILPLPEISRFSMPPPFKDAQNHTWALLHGTPIETAQAILLEGKIRPANWSFNKNLSRCDMPTFGAFYLGREIAKSDTFPDWAAKELMDTIQKKGKGQQVVIVGAMYRGACPHTAFKAGGNEMTEMAQISVADKGVATTSEKYTIAHSNHVGLKFFQASCSRP